MNLMKYPCLKWTIWDMLAVTHECANQVKEQKVNLPVHKQELFKIE